MAKKGGLGLDPLSWIQTSDKKQDSAKRLTETPVVVDGKKIRIVAINCVSPDPEQPRKDIDPKGDDIRELAESIKQHGFINFITVKETEDNKYIIVAGERRYTAAKVSGLKEIPVMVIAEDKNPIDYALIQLEENLQRKDLTAFEEADSYVRLQKDFGLQQKQIVERIGKSKAYISKMLKISKIATAIRPEIEATPTPREVLFELASHPDEDQVLLWKKIKSDPTIAACEKAKKNLERKKQGGQFKKSNFPDADLIFDALKRAVKQDKNKLFQFIPRKKIEQLLQEFSE